MSRSTKSRSNARSRRVTNVNATRSVHRSFVDVLNDLGTSPTVTLRQVQDLRSWHPLGDFRDLRYVDSRPHRLQVKNVNVRRTKFVHVPSRVQFENPLKLVYCMRRRIRRRVFHALRLSGRKGSGVYRKPKFGWYSKISC